MSYDSIYDLWELIVNNFIGFLLVALRCAGIFSFNPILGRNNVPPTVRAAMSLLLGLVIFAYMGGRLDVTFSGFPALAVLLVKEALVGLVFGLITNIMITVLLYAGELVDNQIGLSMAKAMDPGSNIQMSVFANIYFYMFVMYFFITGGHLSYIKLFELSFEAIPVGYNLGPPALSFLYITLMYMGTVMTLAIKFAMPIIAVEMITEFSVGIMMKAVPTIQVFVINIQMKMIIGLLMLVLAAPAMSEYLEKIMNVMWGNLYTALENFV